MVGKECNSFFPPKCSTTFMTNIFRPQCMGFLLKSTNHRISVPNSLSRRLQKLCPVVATHSKPRKPLVVANKIGYKQKERLRIVFSIITIHEYNSLGSAVRFTLEITLVCLILNFVEHVWKRNVPFLCKSNWKARIA